VGVAKKRSNSPYFLPHYKALRIAKKKKKYFHPNAIDRKLIIWLIIGKIILKDGCRREAEGFSRF
jgi:hypothetical protein